MRRAAKVDANEPEGMPADFERFDWARFNVEMRALYGHPRCHFCAEGEACFCGSCVVPTSEEVHHFYCHRCHAEHTAPPVTCPTCGRLWPKGRR